LRSYLALVSIDAAGVVLGFLFANLVRFGDPLAIAGVSYLAILLPVFLALSFSQAAYSVEVLTKPRVGHVRALRALALAAGALLLGLFYAKTSEVMSRAVFGLGVTASAAFLVGGRHMFGRYLGARHQWTFQNDVLLVDHACVGWMDRKNVIYTENAGLDPFHNGPEMAARLGSLLEGYDRVILNCAPERRTQWVKRLKGIGVDLEVLTPELDYLGALALRRTAEGSAVLVAAGPLGLRDRLLKRSLDLVLASMMLFFLAPLMLFIAAAVKVSSPGPVLFKQQRIGRGNVLFTVLKFRTMRAEESDAKGSRSASREDDRVTPVGAFLRRTSLDELPQLLNVLAGSMSIVGPRPHAVGSTAEDNLFWDIDERYWLRGAVKPGITGLAQVRGHRGATSTVRHLTDRVHSDLEYLADWGLSKDIAIILQTARVLVHPNAF
jgi:lipopolysaccharide/colanic/teichoic acid biosynthesis glycosyltransferase